MELTSYNTTGDIYNDADVIIDKCRENAYRAVNVALIQRNWLLGKRIAEEELNGSGRAEYGVQIVTNLSKYLTDKYGGGFAKTNLYQFVTFYNFFPNIFHTLCGKCLVLSWSHYRSLLRVEDEVAREWYAKEALEQTWSVRTLDRNIGSQYYYRMLKSPKPSAVEQEMKEITAGYGYDKMEFIKSPMVAEFLGISQNCDFSESQLEKAIINNVQSFLMELGKGYAFVARQQHIQTAENDYFIDLVFYNYILKCFVLIDLKTSRISYQDVGQMDMYLQLYDQYKKQSDDNPTIGIILCSETDGDVARFSTLAKNDQMFAAKYKLYLPTEEELRREIQRQKNLFLQNQ